jgi:hypothetical protein
MVAAGYVVVRADVHARFRTILERVTVVVAAENVRLFGRRMRSTATVKTVSPHREATSAQAESPAASAEAFIVVDDLIVTDQAAELLGISPPVFNRLHVEGRIHAAGRQGNANLFRRVDVAALGERLRQERATAAAIAADEITSDEAARDLGVSEGQFSRYRTRGWLRPVRTSRYGLGVYLRKDVEAVRRQRRNRAGVLRAARTLRVRIDALVDGANNDGSRTATGVVPCRP